MSGDTSEGLPSTAADPENEDAFALGEEAEEESQGSKFMSLILTNLQVNFEGWKAELPPEPKPEQEEEEEEGDKDQQDTEVHIYNMTFLRLS